MFLLILPIENEVIRVLKERWSRFNPHDFLFGIWTHILDAVHDSPPFYEKWIYVFGVPLPMLGESLFPWQPWKHVEGI